MSNNVNINGATDRTSINFNVTKSIRTAEKAWTKGYCHWNLHALALSSWEHIKCCRSRCNVAGKLYATLTKTLNAISHPLMYVRIASPDKNCVTSLASLTDRFLLSVMLQET